MTEPLVTAKDLDSPEAQEKLKRVYPPSAGQYRRGPNNTDQQKRGGGREVPPFLAYAPSSTQILDVERTFGSPRRPNEIHRRPIRGAGLTRGPTSRVGISQSIRSLRPIYSHRRSTTYAQRRVRVGLIAILDASSRWRRCTRSRSRLNRGRLSSSRPIVRWNTTWSAARMAAGCKTVASRPTAMED